LEASQLDLTVVHAPPSIIDLGSGEVARRLETREKRMDGRETMDQRAPARPPRRRRLAAVGLVASGLLAGGILAGSHIASADSSSSTAASTPAASNRQADPATMNHGPGETLLTDGTASKVEAAALDAVPGGTIIRVETDSAGSPYEAHVRKADGTIVTVKIDDNFNVTSTEPGFGAGGPGAPPNGQGTGA
jgi:hypothetical protein